MPPGNCSNNVEFVINISVVKCLNIHTMLNRDYKRPHINSVKFANRL